MAAEVLSTWLAEIQQAKLRRVLQDPSRCQEAWRMLVEAATSTFNPVVRPTDAAAT
jgi:hypothetical protein